MRKYRFASPPFVWGASLRLWWFGLPLACLLIGTSCTCGEESGIIQTSPLIVSLSQPTETTIAGTSDVLFKVEVDELAGKRDATSEDVRFIQVFATPQGQSADQQRNIAELHSAPFIFAWNTVAWSDGFYLLRAVAYNRFGDQYETRKLIQIANEPPPLQFVNCTDGQFVRGVYSLVVTLFQPKTALKAAPTLSINGLEGPATSERSHPYKYVIDTTKYEEGQTLNLQINAEDLRGNTRSISCRPRVDNVLPTLRFTNPKQDGELLGRTFVASFAASDQFGVKEVRLSIDGSACPQSQGDPDPGCVNNAPWTSSQGPSYPIQVALPDTYKTEQTILLTARAVDQAGNVSEPAARLRIRIDPVAPEIFVRAPGQLEVVEAQVRFAARITDNDLIKRVTFSVEGGDKPVLLLQKTPNLAELTLETSVADASAKFGRGRRTFVVIAEDRSGNISKVERPFSIGCTGAADCPIGQVCLKSKCITPAAVNERCSDDIPCNLRSSCVAGNEPKCSAGKETYCRARCNPGNKFVKPDPCDVGFYCDRTLQVCLPSDKCVPFGGLCGAMAQCISVDADSYHCLPLGTAKLDEPCDESCDAKGNCEKGLWCVFSRISGKNVCRKACDPNKTTPCAAGATCARLPGSFGGAPLAYGVCVQ